MDFIGNLQRAYEVGSQALGDYETGKKMRLGQYNGSDVIKKIGHYNKAGKKLGIYHG